VPDIRTRKPTKTARSTRTPDVPELRTRKPTKTARSTRTPDTPDIRTRKPTKTARPTRTPDVEELRTRKPTKTARSTRTPDTPDIRTRKPTKTTRPTRTPFVKEHEVRTRKPTKTPRPTWTPEPPVPFSPGNVTARCLTDLKPGPKPGEEIVEVKVIVTNSNPGGANVSAARLTVDAAPGAVVGSVNGPSPGGRKPAPVDGAADFSYRILGLTGTVSLSTSVNGNGPNGEPINLAVDCGSVTR
jgi:hypothetical protein